jgi:CRP-like cAMP-binding protein
MAKGSNTTSHPSSAHLTLATLFQTGLRRTYAKGEIILRSDESNNDVFYISDGFIKAYSLNNRGEAYVHLIRAKGEFFPVSWINGHKKHNLYFETLSPCKISVLPQATFRKAIKESLPLSNEVLQWAVEMLDVYGDRLDNLQYKYAQERVIYRLLFLARRFGVTQVDGACLINVPLSQQLIANSINVSRENVSRELERLQRKGLVKYVEKRIAIQDIKSLETLVPGQLNFSFKNTLLNSSE